MKRLLYQYVNGWAKAPSRKPLVLRGARQVGKTHLVRQLGTEFKHFVELNFERQQVLHAIFESDLDPVEILKKLSVILETNIVPGVTLLFLDEIQACPRALIALRYFYEEMPDLHVIAAGSLLDFAIEEVGIPVGRVSFVYMYPMSFLEFLSSAGSNVRVDALLNHNPSVTIDDSIHEVLLQKLSEYMVLGGLPEVVKTWHETGDYTQCRRILQDIANAYRQDFEKYARKTQIKFLELMLNQVPVQLSQQFKYAQVAGEYRKRELAPCLELMKKANVLHTVEQTAAQGRPLAAQLKADRYKVIMHDIGLTQVLLGHALTDWVADYKKAFVNQGALTEAFVGQELLAYQDPTMDPRLYYWRRDASGSQAEVDYVLDLEAGVIPVEVKAGAGSTLKSMHMFLKSHQSTPYGLRFSTHNFSDFEGIKSYPLYAIAKIFQS